ncbi:MAG: superoxide dismutase [Bacteroidetes bacterium GWA2_31_9]|nr:MAG: superoxide dismutase [Bacteroidetes bacterium GWA2_31_9]
METLTKTKHSESTELTGNYPFTLPNLEYSYDALEPFIDRLTMEIHHTKHHAAYVNNLNNALKGIDAENNSLGEILEHVSEYSPTIRNNGGGHYNHSLFWKLLSPYKTKISDELLNEINTTFGTFEKFKEEFSDVAMKRFGSGWAWLIVNDSGKLQIISTPNQDNPLMNVTAVKGYPLLCIDVWEHAYYLNYQNKRNDYIIAFFNIINWKEVDERFRKFKK